MGQLNERGRAEDIFFFFNFVSGKDGKALYSQQKQDWELTVAQIMNS